MTGLLTSEAITAFFQVIMIDLVLAGDNAIVIALAAAGLPHEQRTKAILIGIGAATALRIVFAGITTQLLRLVGLLLAGAFSSSGYAGRCGESCAHRSSKGRRPPRH
jgi:predicted tellurium resistance membrane protein TerC